MLAACHMPNVSLCKRDLLLPRELFCLCDQLAFLHEPPCIPQDTFQFFNCEASQGVEGPDAGIIQFLFDRRSDASDDF